MSIKKVYLLRHGQTDYNLQGIIQGSGVDSSLNATGRQQADLFFQCYKHVAFDKVYTSVLQRSIQSVQGFIDLGIPHETHAGLNEICWGTREGTRVTPEEDAYYFDVLQKWQDGDITLRIDGGESPQDVADRQQNFLDVLLSRPEEQTVLICMHGRAMRILLCKLLNYPLHCMDLFEHHNLCLYLLQYTGSMFSVHRHMDIEHLRPMF
ncbi:histidine phosphatase family protein [Adhaeribacter radiodurans]|uniref:Histidine phosphatase family protein n=1 Tax=Adhaeribacter radiodurans TaxID=2745197 RepID=A0A7L7L835_9BACT|nr:histidine phosphatase family protein [Adhaeribacter radiodurans]QMU28539.1 histidine phosphatase family protein [Adhaeribacter radiodurans]